MNNYIIKYLLSITMLIGIVSCKKNNLAVDKDPLVLPEAARFLKSPLTDNFYIQTTPSGGSTYKIPIGITTASSTDRTIEFSYQSGTATNGTHYKAPVTLTIPAGKVVDTLVIQGLYDAYNTPGRKDVLKIKIAESAGRIAPNAYSDSVVLTLQKYCTVVLSALEGLYENTNEYTSSGAFSYGPYTTALIDMQSVSATSAKGFIVNIYDFGWNDIEATFDWADPSNFSVSIALQNTGSTDNDGNPLFVRSTPGKTNTFSSCDETISLSIDLIAGPDGKTIISSGYQVRLQR